MANALRCNRQSLHLRFINSKLKYFKGLTMVGPRAALERQKEYSTKFYTCSTTIQRENKGTGARQKQGEARK